MALTAKQERFAQAIAGGVDQSEAYRRAYDASNMKPDAVASNAYKLAKEHTDIALRVTELRAPATHELQVTLYDLITKFVEIAAEGARDRVPALREIGRLQGLYQNPEPRDQRLVQVTQVTVILDRGAGRQELGTLGLPVSEARVVEGEGTVVEE